MKPKSMYEHHSVDVLFNFSGVHTYQFEIQLCIEAFLDNPFEKPSRFLLVFPSVEWQGPSYDQTPHQFPHGKVSTTNSRGGNQKPLFFLDFHRISTVRFRIKTPPKSQVLATNPDLPSSPMGHTPGPGPVCVERAPCEVFTSGTLVDPELLQGVTKNFPKKPRSSRVG